MLDGLKILLAEDNPTNQMVAVQMLEALGANVTVAADGVEALEIIEAQPFDVLLIDIEMPRKNGIDVIRTLRVPGGRHAGLPMIALTAYVMREHRQAIDAAGADGVIAKPIISIAEFGEQILALSAGRRGRMLPGEAAPDPIDAENAHDAPVPSVAPDTAPAVAATAANRRGAPINSATLAVLGSAVGAAALEEILEKAEADLRDAGAEVARGLAEGDADILRGALHIITGLAGTVGAERLESAARALQEAVRSGDETQTIVLRESLPKEIEAAVRGLGAARLA